MIRMKFLEPLHILFICKDIVSIFKTFLILFIISGGNLMASKDLLLDPLSDETSELESLSNMALTLD